MKTFIIFVDFLEDEIFNWYKKLSRRKISSLSKNVKEFLKNWLPLYERDKCEGVIAYLGQHMVPYPQEDYFSTIQHWIGDCCRGTCTLGNVYNVVDYPRDDI
jgi:hypothetical protein